MEQALIDRLCRLALDKEPLCVQRCAQGIGNDVYRLDFPDGCCALRCSREPDAYQETVLRLQQLAELDVPVPRILWNGRLEGWQCLLLTWLEGRDMGVVYPALTREEKQAIAQEVEAIQRRVAALPVEVPPDWCWQQEVDSLLDLQYDTDYTDFLLEAFSPNQTQRKAFTFYTLLYCVDFLGERGSIFLDKRVPVSPEIINKLNHIFDGLWEDYRKSDTPVTSV